MNILITGSSGYIGKNLTEYLSKKYTLLIPSHKQLDLLSETEVERYFKNNKIDTVIHAAVVGGSRKEERQNNMFYESLRMFFNIVRNKKYFNKMINLGSGAEYDKRFPIVKIKEEDFDKRVPADEYGYYKYLCAKYIEASDSILNLRIFGLFGKYEDYRYRFISNAICRSLFDLPITISQNVFFDYVYIEDFVKIVEFFINNKVKFKSYNIGTGKPIDLRTIAEKISKLGNNKSKILIRKKGVAKEYTCDNRRLMEEMKNFEFTNFDAALNHLYNWYRKNLDKINKKEL